MKKSTEELLAQMKNAGTINDFLDQNADNLISVSLSDALSDCVAKSGEKPAEIFRRAGIEKSYGYDILKGKRSPSRDKVLAIVFALSLSAADTQRLLKTCGYPPLYPRHTRDAVILFCLDRSLGLADVNETLYDMGLEEVG